MNADVLFAVGFLIVAVISYYYWRKRSEKSYLLWALFAFIAGIVNLVDYGIKNVFHPPLLIKLISNKFLLILLPIIVITSIFVLFKSSKRKNTKEK
jgi:lipoprotein signal peptidase